MRKGFYQEHTWQALIVAAMLLLSLGFFWPSDMREDSLSLLEELRAVPGVVVTEYSVVGSTPAAVKQDILEHGPRDSLGGWHAGLTTWSIDWSWLDEQGHVDFTKAKARYEIEVTVPRWEGELRASVIDQQRWETFLVALLHHERRHVSFVLNNYQKLAEEVRDEASKNPLLTVLEAHQIAERHLARIRQLDREYDDRTDHGRNEGAKIP